MADVTHKNVTNEDAVSTFGEGAIEFLDLYWRRVLIALLAIVVLILVFWSNSLTTRANEAKASSSLSELQQSLQSALGAPDAKEADKMLDSVVSGCKDLAGSSASTPAGREAIYIQGHALYLKGEYAEAAKAFQQYLSLVTTNDEKAKAQNALGLVFEDQLFEKPQDKELATQAQTAYDAALKLGQDEAGTLNVYGRQAAMGVGRVAEIQGDYDKARAAYEKVVAAPSPVDETTSADAKQTQGRRSREERADSIRKVLREVDTQYSYKHLAEQRLELLKARNQGAEKPDVHGTH